MAQKGPQHDRMCLFFPEIKAGFYNLFLDPLVNPVRDSRTAPGNSLAALRAARGPRKTEGAADARLLPSFLAYQRTTPLGPAVRGRRGRPSCLAGNLSVCLLSLSLCLSGLAVWLSGSVWSGSLSSWAILRANRQVDYESGHPWIQNRFCIGNPGKTTWKFSENALKI